VNRTLEYVAIMKERKWAAHKGGFTLLFIEVNSVWPNEMLRGLLSSSDVIGKIKSTRIRYMRHVA
jgi:hypothetical protein